MEDIVLNRDRLEIILQAVEQERDRPRIDDAIPYLGIILALLLSLVPRDFQDFLGFSKDVWTAFSLIGTFLSTLKVLHIWWQVIKLRNVPRKTCAQIVQEVVNEMRERRTSYQIQQAAQIPRANVYDAS